MGDWFSVKVWLCQGCDMSPWLFSFYMEVVVREVKSKLLGRGLSLLNEDGGAWNVNQLLFADDTTLMVDSQ